MASQHGQSYCHICTENLNLFSRLAFLFNLSHSAIILNLDLFSRYLLIFILLHLYFPSIHTFLENKLKFAKKKTYSKFIYFQRKKDLRKR